MAHYAVEKALPWLFGIKQGASSASCSLCNAGRPLGSLSLSFLISETSLSPLPTHCTSLLLGMAGMWPFLWPMLTLGTSPASCFSSWLSRVVFLERVCVLMRDSRSRSVSCSTLVYLEAAPTEEREGVGPQADPGRQAPLAHLARHPLGASSQAPVTPIRTSSHRKSTGL